MVAILNVETPLTTPSYSSSNSDRRPPPHRVAPLSAMVHRPGTSTWVEKSRERFFKKKKILLLVGRACVSWCTCGGQVTTLWGNLKYHRQDPQLGKEFTGGEDTDLFQRT